MNQRESSSAFEKIIGLPELSNSSQSQEYFKRMVQIKDKNIEDLLKELRETKEIYYEYKNQYVSEQKKIKARLTQISAKLDAQSGQLERYQQMNAKLKSGLEASAEKEKRVVETYQKQLKQLKNSLAQSQAKNRQLSMEKNLMAENQGTLEQKCNKLEECLKSKTDEARIYEDETRRIREELLRREEEWKREKKLLIEKGQEQVKRRAAKDKTNCRLDALESKIKSTLMKI